MDDCRQPTQWMTHAAQGDTCTPVSDWQMRAHRHMTAAVYPNLANANINKDNPCKWVWLFIHVLFCDTQKETETPSHQHRCDVPSIKSFFSTIYFTFFSPFSDSFKTQLNLPFLTYTHRTNTVLKIWVIMRCLMSSPCLSFPSLVTHYRKHLPSRFYTYFPKEIDMQQLCKQWCDTLYSCVRVKPNCFFAITGSIEGVKVGSLPASHLKLHLKKWVPSKKLVEALKNGLYTIKTTNCFRLS